MDFVPNSKLQRKRDGNDVSSEGSTFTAAVSEVHIEEL